MLQQGKIKVKYAILLFFIYFLIGCAPTSAKCVNVAYFDYGEKGIFQHLYWFEGDFYDEPFYVYKGMVLAEMVSVGGGLVKDGLVEIMPSEHCFRFCNRCCI